MKIHSAKTVQVKKWVTLKVTHNKKQFEISVFTVDGKVEAKSEKQGVYTSFLTYFNNVPDKVRAKHLEQIKEYVERYIR